MKKSVESKMFPPPTRKIYELVLEETGGEVKAFAELIGISQQSFNRVFCKDPRNGKYPTLSQKIKQAIMDKFGFDESWFYVDESPSAVVNQQGSRNAVSSIGDSNTINISDVSDQDLKIEILQERYDEAMRYVKKLEADNIVLQETNKRLLDMLERALSGATSSVQSKAQ